MFKFQECILVLQFLKRSLPMPKTQTLNLRVSTEFKKRLIEEAARENRSVTNYVESTLKVFWQQRENGEGKGKGKRS
jgi:hypothetical protein